MYINKSTNCKINQYIVKKKYELIEIVTIKVRSVVGLNTLIAIIIKRGCNTFRQQISIAINSHKTKDCNRMYSNHNYTH